MLHVAFMVFWKTRWVLFLGEHPRFVARPAESWRRVLAE